MPCKVVSPSRADRLKSKGDFVNTPSREERRRERRERRGGERGEEERRRGGEKGPHSLDSQVLLLYCSLENKIKSIGQSTKSNHHSNPNPTLFDNQESS